MNIDAFNDDEKGYFIAWHIIAALRRIYENKDEERIKDSYNFFDHQIVEYFINKNNFISFSSKGDEIKRMYYSQIISYEIRHTLLYCNKKYNFIMEPEEDIKTYNSLCSFLMNEDQEFKKIYLSYYDIFSTKRIKE